MKEEFGPKVSVIVPVYAVEKYIRQCVHSLFSQTWEDCEFIFVDDGSPDRSIAILEDVLDREFPQRRSQVKILHEANSGPQIARVTGLEAATGDFVIQVDSDDWAEPDYIKRLVETAVEEDADVVYCDFFKEYPKKNKVYREGDFTPSTGPVAAKCMHNSIIRGYMWNKLERRSLYDLSSMFIPRHGYHEDLVFQTQALCKADKVFHLKEPLYHYRRRRKGALTAGSLIKTHRQSSENMLLFYDALPKDGVTLKACGIDILLRGGWYCACTLDFKLLREHPDAVKALLEADYVRGGRVPVSKQRFTKFICRLLRL
jgi:glycosyltransferase involved in cell wall biosynthesis